MILIDAANVVGSRPTGWWKDRPGAARTLVERVRTATTAGALDAPVVIVLEGAARKGVEEGTSDGVQIVHARGSGDDALADIASRATESVILVSADRGLRERLPAHGRSVGPSWLYDRLPSDQ